MLDNLHSNLITEILTQLDHPVNLFKIRLINKRFKSIVDHQQTRRFLYRRWYNASIEQDRISLVQLVFCYKPGAQRYFSAECCLIKACQSCDLASINYFGKLVASDKLTSALDLLAFDNISIPSAESIESYCKHFNSAHITYLYGLSGLKPQYTPAFSIFFVGAIHGGHDVSIVSIKEGSFYEVTILQVTFKVELRDILNSLRYYNRKDRRMRIYNATNYSILARLIDKVDLLLLFAPVLTYSEICKQVCDFVQYRRPDILRLLCQTLSYKRPSFESYIVHQKRFIADFSTFGSPLTSLKTILLDCKLDKKQKQEFLHYFVCEIEDHDLYDKFIERYYTDNNALSAALFNIRMGLDSRSDSKLNLRLLNLAEAVRRRDQRKRNDISRQKRKVSENKTKD